MRITTILFLLSISFYAFAQSPQPPASSGEARLKAFEQRKKLAEQSLVSNIPFRNIGPTVFSGRVTDVAVNPQDPSIFYAAYASGGLWKTESNGAAFTPIFDDEVVMTIGDIAVDWERDVIWIGSGENNSSRSSYSGVGLFKSTDGGKNWEHKGLPESHHIGRIILHPTDPNTLWVAVLGHLYSPNKERGIYKTTDGGTTWEQVLFVNENAGAIDLLIDPTDANVLYASTWHRERRSWNFVESGVGSGIYKSTDGGNNWVKMSGGTSGFPDGEGAGRIGLAITQKNNKTLLYAIVDNYFRRPEDKEDKESGELTKDDFRKMSKDDFLKIEEKDLGVFLEDNGFPEKYSAEKVKKMITKGKITPLALVEYLEDANSLLFDTPVIGAEVYSSTDGGKTWQRTHENFLNDVYYSYGYYFGQVRVAPTNPDKIYIYGVPILKSEDGGKTFARIGGPNVHVDHHALWVDPNRDGHLILGNDGGIHISYDDGINWNKCNSLSVGQFYSVAVDMETPYNVYGGLQDNGVWRGPSTYKAGKGWHNSGQYPYKSIMGGDGMHVAIDTRDNNIVYTGFQFGNYFRINQKKEETKYITPKHELGERPFRWNWQGPIHLSIHNQDILYMGSNKLHRSFNQGEDFEVISKDLTTGGKKGDIAFSTLTSIHESPLKFGLLYVGTDDGLVHITKDGGNTWQQITTGLPKDMWVTRIQASAHEESVVYVSMNGYRWDDFNSYVYRSNDYGKTWIAIGKDLPMEPVNVIKEDPENANLVYVGTDHGLYISLNKGDSFMLMNKDLPAVAVHDLVVHPRDHDLVIGTHGRSFYVADVSHLQEMDTEALDKKLLAFDLEKIKYRSGWGSRGYTWAKEISVPKFQIPFYAKTSGEMTIKVKTKKGMLIKEWKTKADAGINFEDYDLTLTENVVAGYEQFLNKEKDKADKTIKVKKAKNDAYYLRPGTYEVELTKDGVVEKKELVVK